MSYCPDGCGRTQKELAETKAALEGAKRDRENALQQCANMEARFKRFCQAWQEDIAALRDLASINGPTTCVNASAQADDMQEILEES